MSTNHTTFAIAQLESEIAAFEHVREACVAIQYRGLGDPELIAHIVPLSMHPSQRNAVIRQLAGRLPDYLRPARWVVWDELPRGPDGAVDRDLLHAEAGVGELTTSQAACGETRHATAARVLAFMTDISPELAPDVTARFFDTGFHSIKLMSLVAKCRLHYGVRLTLSEAMRAATPIELAQVIDARVADTAPPR